MKRIVLFVQMIIMCNCFLLSQTIDEKSSGIGSDSSRINNFEKEKLKIKETLQYFFDGLDEVNTEMILKAFYPTAFSYTFENGYITGNPVIEWNSLLAKVRENPNHPFMKEKSKKIIKYIDISGCAASCRVDWIFSDFMFTDYYNLIKDKNRWYIVNKTYSTHQLCKE